MRKMVFVIILVFIFSSGILPNTTSASRDSEAYPDVKIALKESSRFVQPSPIESTPVFFDGLVIVTFPTGYENPAAYINITLSAVDTWGSAVITPKSYLCTEDGEYPFNVSITVPPKTSYTFQGSVTILGKWTMEPTGFSSIADPQGGVMGRVNINQYYNFSLSCTQDKMTGHISRRITYRLAIHNQGNFMDTFTIEIVNLEELSDNCINIMESQRNIEILENDTEMVKIWVTPGDSTKCLGNHEIKVRVWSDKGIDEGVEPEEFSFELEVPQEQMINTTEFQNCLLVVIIAVVFIVFFTWRRRQRKRKDVVRC